MPTLKHKRQFDHLASFPSSREEISQVTCFKKGNLFMLYGFVFVNMLLLIRT